MQIGELSLFALAIVAFSVLCLLIFLSCFKMPPSFSNREQVRRDLRLRIIQRNIREKEHPAGEQEQER